MDKFQKEKNDFLTKIDKSKKHSTDKKIIKLINLINKNPNYYTTSSCSGRIRVIEVPEDNKRYNIDTLFLSHDKVKIDNQIMNNLIKNINRKIIYNKNKKIISRIYFQYESLILHVCCRTIEKADKLLNSARGIGLKRSGIISKDRKIICEIINEDYIFTPIAKNNKLLIDKNYLRELIEEANEKMEKNEGKLMAFYSLLEHI